MSGYAKKNNSLEEKEEENAVGVCPVHFSISTETNVHDIAIKIINKHFYMILFFLVTVSPCVGEWVGVLTHTYSDIYRTSLKKKHPFPLLNNSSLV